MEGVPRGATKLQLVAAPDGGFSESGGRLGRARQLDIESAVVCCHGGPGEDENLQAALDLAGIAYTGPSVAGASVGMDKLSFGALMADAGLPTLPRLLLTADSAAPSFDGPYILKPRFGGPPSESTWSRISPPPRPACPPIRIFAPARSSSRFAPT